VDHTEDHYELNSIERLNRDRQGRAPDRSGLRMVDGESRSWALPEPSYRPQPFVPSTSGARRLPYETVTEQGAHVSVLLTCEPIWDLAKGEPVATYLRERRRVVAKPDAEDDAAVELSPADQVRHEGLKFRRGLALLEEHSPGYGVMRTPWSMLTQSRAAFTALNTGVRGRVDPAVRLIGEIGDIPAGAQPRAVKEAVRFLGERRRTVILRLPPDAEALDAVAGSGARGVCYSIAGPALEGHGEGQAWARLAALLNATRRLAPLVLLDQAPPERADALLAAGATHAVFAPMRARLV